MKKIEAIVRHHKLEEVKNGLTQMGITGMTVTEVPTQDDAYGPELYGPELSQVYDLLYRGRGKQFPAEAAVVARVVRERRPDACIHVDGAFGMWAAASPALRPTR